MSQPPRSPWLRKYGGGEDNALNTVGDTIVHSGFAPFFPWLHPTYFAEESQLFERFPPCPLPSGHDLDMLFATEAFQMLYNGGLTTWEMSVLREHLPGERLGGHRQTDPITPYFLDVGPGVRVDEENWNPVFARSKWYDFRRPIVDGTFIKGPLPGISASDVWSVDVPKLWAELRVSVELSNRWLLCMAGGSWLNQMVHEERVEWFEAEPPSADLDHAASMLGPNGKPWKIPARSTACDAEKTLKAIAKIAPKLVWTFSDDGYHFHDSADNEDYYGVTIKQWNDGDEPDEHTPAEQRQPAFIMTCIHVAPLRVLLNPLSTLTERSHARWSLAMTMLHELMHAINMARDLENTAPTREPYYDQEWDRELGSSAIKSLFGGEIGEAPIVDTAGKSGYKFAAWHFSHLLESFYATTVQKYGLAAFQAPRIFSAPLIYRGCYSEVRRAESVVSATSVELSHLIPSVRATLADLEARRLTWKRLRPWYSRERRLWRLTPYSNVDLRASVARFAAAAHPLRRLSEADAVDAERKADAVASEMDHWFNFHETREGVDGLFPRRDWVFAVLAVLMQAVLPARHEGVFEVPHRVVVNTWFPSQAALAGGEGTWRFAPVRIILRELASEFNLPDRHLEGHVETGENGEVVRQKSSRMWLLEMALNMIREREVTEPLPMALSKALEEEVRSLFLQHTFEKKDEEWLDWGFKFPTYDRHLMRKNEHGMYVPWTGYNPTMAQGAPGSASDPSAHPAQARAAQVGGGRMRQDLGSPDAPTPTRYFTVSEVGDTTLNEPTGTSLALLPDGMGGYDVVDVGDLPGFGAKVDTEPVFESTELGRVIVSQKLVKALQANNRKPLGKLLTCKHPQEVFEHDGRDGRALWCVIGHFVYDITAFPFRSEAEKEALLALARGGKSPTEALNGQDVADLLSRLSPYKCGFLRQTTPATITSSTLRTFTLRELGKHIYPQIGMYCAIDGYVYDLGRYLHSHPGGAQILCQYAGRDVTDEFKNAHLQWQQTLMNHEALKVGRVIDEMPQGRSLGRNKIALLNRVFDISKLCSEDPDLYRDLRPYSGADSTNALKAGNAPDALVRLFGRDDLVCAKIVEDTKKPIARSELGRHCRIPSADERRRKPRAEEADWRVWVAVPEADGSDKQMVYDVTFMVMFGGPDLERKLRPWLGKEVRDGEIAEMLRSRHQTFIIGELHEGDQRSGRQDVAGSKRRAGAVDDGDSGIVREPKRLKSRR
ncbi:hypothetical protein VTH06DRAFT_164 [Thermothelomyces fergusii]